MRRVVTILASAIGIAFLIGLGAFLYMKTEMHGFSARAEPSRTEAMLATYARETAMPDSAKARRNPIRFTPEVQHEAMAHFADHCAVCHANNGSGQTMFGQGMYPKPPDLRMTRTQNLSDGEIFYIIENGIRMSGMPAFGGEATDTADDTWKLVLLIRHLPQLTASEEQQMDALNPKTPSEAEEDKEEEQFLNGGATNTKSSPMHK
ncbi:c-type cytochrome [Terriglobus aquaticus]|uniref:C-type cytochrome n=1 Tax=Terriglobus aquaticus TaxID=940139 RepID=A0ABW9KP72_9BACT